MTSFFRDPEAFATLSKTGLKPLLEHASTDPGLRVWVPGCVIGEEAYSLAILLRENTGQPKKPISVQIFGTDLDSHAIDVARAGIYPDGIAVDVSRERLANFFTKEDGDFHLKKEVREMVIRLEKINGALTLRITDDGNGFASSRGDGMGFHVMQHRTSVIGALLTVESKPDEGVTGTCRLPETQ